MKTTDLLLDAFGRIAEEVADTVEGLSEDQLAFRPGAGANSIAWLVWHLTRVQDNHVAEAARRARDLDRGRLGRPVRAVAGPRRHRLWPQRRRGGEGPHLRRALTGYADAVGERTRRYLSSLDDEALDRVVDERWDPPVTLGVRLVSVIGDDMAHLGQAQYVRGLQQRA